MLLSIDVARPDNVSYKNRTLRLQCDACGESFEHKYKKSYAEKPRHFCSKKMRRRGKQVGKNDTCKSVDDDGLLLQAMTSDRH